MQKFLLPLILISIFIFESVVVLLFSGKLYSGTFIIVPHFLFITIVFHAIFVDEKYGLIYGIIFGLIYDVVFTEILGVYLFLYPVIAYSLAKLATYLFNNIVVVSFVSLIGLSLLEIIVYQINFLINYTNFEFTYFIVNRLLPTLILNIVFLIVFSYPLKKRFSELALHLKNE